LNYKQFFLLSILISYCTVSIAEDIPEEATLKIYQGDVKLIDEQDISVPTSLLLKALSKDAGGSGVDEKGDVKARITPENSGFAVNPTICKSDSLIAGGVGCTFTISIEPNSTSELVKLEFIRGMNLEGTGENVWRYFKLKKDSSSSPPQKATISLSATDLTNDTLDFGDVEVGQNESTQVTISSNISLENMSVTVSGNTFSNSCLSNVCTVTFEPTTSGAVTGTLKITANNADEKTITLKGNGKEAEQKSFTLTTTSEPNNGGSIQCGGNACKSSYPENSEVTLSAKANEGFTFDGFSGDCSGETCILTMDSDKIIGATFKQDEQDTTSPCDGELVNDVCISVPSGFSKKSVLGLDKDGKEVTLTTQFYGSVNGKSVETSVRFSENESVNVEGFIVPDTQHVGKNADIIVVGLYTESNKLQADCDPANGHFYMNTAGFKNKYCNWIVNGRPDDECNDRNLRDKPTHANDFWNLWDGHMSSLKPMYTGVTLNETGVNQVVYADTIGNYQGQVCLYFGYRLADQTLVFNSDPIVFITK